MELMKEDVERIDMSEYIHVLLHKWWLILLIGSLGAVFAGLYTINFVTPIYQSTSKVYVINRQEEDVTTWADIQSGSYIAQDFMIIVKSRPVIEEVIRRLSLTMTEEELAKQISVYTPADTRIMEITTSHPDPLEAKRLVDAVTEVSAERMVSVMQMEKVNIVEEGSIQTKPSGPNVINNIVIGGLLGILVTSATLILKTLTNDSIETSEDIEKYLGIYTLGVIPKDDYKAKNGRLRAYGRKKKIPMPDKELRDDAN